MTKDDRTVERRWMEASRPSSAMRRERQLVVLGGGAAVAFVVAVVVTVAVLWESHARERVRFRGRDYVTPSLISKAEAPSGLRPVDGRIRGMQVMIPVSQADDPIPTVILLRRGDGRFVVYSLSGGT